MNIEDFECIFALTGCDGENYAVGVSKVGGGTPGHEYEGLWEWIITKGGITLASYEASGFDLINTGSKYTHEEAAESAMIFFCESGE